MSDTGTVDTIEVISSSGQELTYIIRASYRPTETTFVTPPELKQQVGYIVYPAGAEIPRHVHRAIERHIVGTSEVLVIKSGRCLIDIYDDAQRLIDGGENITLCEASAVEIAHQRSLLVTTSSPPLACGAARQIRVGFEPVLPKGFLHGLRGGPTSKQIGTQSTPT